MDVDVLIIGAGLAGASTAYHLRRRCDTEGRDVRVLVVDKEPQPGVHSSGRNAALVRLHTDDPAIAEVTRQGARRIIDEHLAPFRRT
ncbi:MAG: FAD-dependent oxidoreductase, partial [Phycisphaerae bacterium]